MLADLQTVAQQVASGSAGADVASALRSVRYAWIGDGNNMANSWIEAAGILGLDLALACPAGYEPDAAVFERARQTERGRIVITHDPAEAVAGRHVISTDVFASMVFLGGWGGVAWVGLWCWGVGGGRALGAPTHER